MPARAGDIEKVPLTPDIVRLTGDHQALRLAWGVPQSVPLLPDPGEALDDRQPNSLVTDPVGGSDPHPAIGRIDGDVDMLDGLVNNVDIETGDDQGGANGTHHAP